MKNPEKPFETKDIIEDPVSKIEFDLDRQKRLDNASNELWGSNARVNESEEENPSKKKRPARDSIDIIPWEDVDIEET